MDARHPHFVMERGLAFVRGASDGRGSRGFGRTTQGNVSFARKQSAGRVQSNPAGSGQKHLAPCVQVSEVGTWPGRAIERLNVGGKLDQITAHEAGRQTEMA